MAGLSVASRRLPGISQRNILPIASIPGGMQRPIELPHLETFPGAARCKPIELQCYKAAPSRRRALYPLQPPAIMSRSFGAIKQLLPQKFLHCR
jgi:hypothetical protein